ncbi:TonB-dependent receptor plug domain-containing protein [Psychroflexus maritimus]|uniref:TonB-dependent receptor n=1 Tax=Psychroflexus maritimus TaxID=2714865 RepID=A0A967E5R6_9FLAO|nr:TonB-dependent receptor [Psychroflexus maritimus]NGZ88971.1 TonB-dependent receptor [Psychroflexus maritimus]
MRVKFFSFFFICFNFIAFSQEVYVADLGNNSPIEGVQISTLSGDTLTTNAEGKINLSSLKAQDEIQFSHPNFQSLKTSYSGLVQSDFKIYLISRNIALDDVVVSGSRWRQASNKIPAKVTSISAKEVQLYMPQNAADLLETSGKVFVQKSQQGGGSPMIRGFAANRLLYSVDGVRMNTAIFRGGNIQNVINLDPFVMESTEVLFGANSVIYGSDAMGGVMSFQSLQPELFLSDEIKVKGNAVVRHSTANSEKTGHFNVRIGAKKWAFVSSFSRWEFDDLIQGRSGPKDYLKTQHVKRIDGADVVVEQDNPRKQVPSAYSQFNTLQKIRFKPNEKWDFQYAFHFSETSSFGRYDRHNRLRNGLPQYAQWDYGPQQWMMNHLSFSYKNEALFFDQMNFSLAQQSFEESRIIRLLNSNTQRQQVENLNTYALNIDFKKKLGTKNTLYYGTEWVTNLVDSKGELTDINSMETETGPARYPEATWQSVGIYAKNEYVFSNQLLLLAGLRYNHFSIDADFSNNLAFYPLPFDHAQVNDAALTASIGSVYTPSNDWVLKANFGTAFRSPNVDDLGKVFDSEPGAVTVPNPNLAAEYAYNIDVSLSKIIGKHLKVELDAYATLLNNAMVRRDFQLNGLDSISFEGTPSKVQAIQNASKAKIYGFQLGMELKVLKNLIFTSDLNYQIGREEMEDGSTSPSRHAPPFFGVNRLQYRKAKWTVELNTFFQGEMSFENLALEERLKDEIYAKDANGNNFSPAWYTLNLKSLYKFSSSYAVSFGVENITDQRYRPYSSGISGAGLNFVASVMINF